MFKIIEDETVPRGTVRFEPVMSEIEVSPIYGLWDHNVSVNPLDFKYYPLHGDALIPQPGCVYDFRFYPGGMIVESVERL